MASRQEQVREILLKRIAGGLHRGHLQPGQRLPSTRQLGCELRVAPRTVMAAYADLARQGLVELRCRSGIYLAAAATGLSLEATPPQWEVELFLGALQHGFPPRTVPQELGRLLDTSGQLALCLAGNDDQADHLCRELQADYGLPAVPAVIDNNHLPPDSTSDPSLVVSTALVAPTARAIQRLLGLPLVVVRLREEIIRRMVEQLRAEPVYFVATDRRFGHALQVIFQPTGVAHNLRLIVLGQEDPESIPADAPVYILDRAWERLGDTPLTRRVKPLQRVFSDHTARQILSAIVRRNLSRRPASQGSTRSIALQ